MQDPHTPPCRVAREAVGIAAEMSPMAKERTSMRSGEAPGITAKNDTMEEASGNAKLRAGSAKTK